MVIDTNNINAPGAGIARGRTAPSGGANTAPTPPLGNQTDSSKSADSVELSQQAQTMSRIESGIKASPDVDMDKVEAIKTAIAEGRFEINADAIADKMMNQDELLG